MRKLHRQAPLQLRENLYASVRWNLSRCTTFRESCFVTNTFRVVTSKKVFMCSSKWVIKESLISLSLVFSIKSSAKSSGDSNVDRVSNPLVPSDTCVTN